MQNKWCQITVPPNIRNNRKWYKTDLDAELIQVKHNSNNMAFITKILFLINNYIINERDDNIPYPFSGLAVNSNSWTQSVILAASGKVASDFKGLDTPNNLYKQLKLKHSGKSRIYSGFVGVIPLAGDKYDLVIE